MAKSARASSKKTSRSKLRATVTGPQEEARLQRLSEKLLAVASTEKPTVPASTMEVDEDASKQITEENSSLEQVKGLSTSTSSQKPSEAAAPLSHDFKLPIPASFLEESVGSTCRSINRPTFDEEMFYNALGLFPIADIQGFDEFKCLRLAVS